MKITQKPGVQFLSGIPLIVRNEVRQRSPDFYVSYDASYGAYGSPTTALVFSVDQIDKFYILRGDHRKQYEDAATLEGCLAYYRANPALQHEYSDKLCEEDAVEEPLVARQRHR